MSRATSDVSDGDIVCALADGHAIISGSDDGVKYIDKTGIAQMNPVGVGAFTVSRNVDVTECKVFAPIYVGVEQLAV